MWVLGSVPPTASSGCYGDHGGRGQREASLGSIGCCSPPALALSEIRKKQGHRSNSEEKNMCAFPWHVNSKRLG